MVAARNQCQLPMLRLLHVVEQVVIGLVVADCILVSDQPQLGRAQLLGVLKHF